MHIHILAGECYAEILKLRWRKLVHGRFDRAEPSQVSSLKSAFARMRDTLQ